VGREDPGGAADVQDAAFAAEQDGDDVGVAGDLPDRGGRDPAGEGERPGAGDGGGMLAGDPLLVPAAGER